MFCSWLGNAYATSLPPGVEGFPGIQQTKPQPVPDVSEVGLEHTRCLAVCRAYSVTFQADGSFRYTGVYNVRHMSEHTDEVDVGQLRQLFRYTSEIGFADLKKNYLSPFLDATVTTRVVQNGAQKTGMNYANSGPATL